MACCQRFGYRSKSEGWDFGSLKELLAMLEQTLWMLPLPVTVAFVNTARGMLGF
jgi:hypothetical protein